jgi:hypothetical protein
VNWFHVKLKYYLGVLVLIDALETADRPDLLLIIADVREEVEHGAFNVLKFGLETTHAICIPGSGEGTDRTPPTDTTSDPSTQAITMSLIAIYPCPQSVIDTVLFLKEVVGHRLHHGNLGTETYSHLVSILTGVLDLQCRSIL